MIKPTPNPPETDPENLDSVNHPEDPDRIPSAADIRATPRKPCTMYIIDPQIDTQTGVNDRPWPDQQNVPSPGSV